MSAKKPPEELKTRITLSLSTEDVKRFDNYIDHLRVLCETNGAKGEDVSRTLTRSGLLTAAVKLMGIPEYQKAVDLAIAASMHLNVAQTELEL